MEGQGRGGFEAGRQVAVHGQDAGADAGLADGGGAVAEDFGEEWGFWVVGGWGLEEGASGAERGERVLEDAVEVGGEVPAGEPGGGVGGGGGGG